MNIGFTGTRRGMTPMQTRSVGQILYRLRMTEKLESFHHGDCVGADDEAAAMAYMAGVPIICHPPADEAHRAFNALARETRPALTHFARNRQIVAECDMLIATPCDATEQPYGGTWMTVRFARKVGKQVVIIWPDGTVEVDEKKPC